MTDEIEAHVLSRFDIRNKLGKGAYGVVWKGVDRMSQSTVAVKKCFDAFRNATDAQRTYREVMYLQALAGHENIVQLLHVIRSERDQDLYLTFECMETDLQVVIRANILQEVHQKYIVYQMLKALKYIHSAGLIHRDIKPSNVLLNSKCDAKLCDFGLVCSVAEVGNSKRLLTDYVATRWYRSPEVLVGSTQYSQAIDMWAVGCVVGEMISTSPIFQGANTMNQIGKIFELHGAPTKEDIEALKAPNAKTMIESISFSSQRSLADICSGASLEALDFMHQTLQISPLKRCTAEEGLKHPYVKDFHRPASEPKFPHGDIRIKISDDAKLSSDDYRNHLYAEMIKRRKEIKETSRRRFQRVGPAATAPDVQNDDSVAS